MSSDHHYKYETSQNFHFPYFVSALRSPSKFRFQLSMIMLTPVEEAYTNDGVRPLYMRPLLWVYGLCEAFLSYQCMAFAVARE